MTFRIWGITIHLVFEPVNFLLISLCILVANFSEVHAQLNNLPNRNPSESSAASYREILDSTVNLSLEWTINKHDKTIIFNVRANVPQVSLALTNRGKLEDSDVVVCGIDENGAAYVFDMHAGGTNNMIILDNRQNWRIISSSGSSNYFQIQIKRRLDTCDEQDIPIKSEVIDLLWDWHSQTQHTFPVQIFPKGAKRIFFQDPNILPVGSNFNPESTFRISRTMRIPNRRTTYWCSIHKMNVTFHTPHHIYGFSTSFGSEAHRPHIHHQLLYRCNPPAPGVDPKPLFEHLVNHPGNECYLNPDPQQPTPWCRELVYLYLVGGEPVQLPETVGLTIGTTPTQYFMLETHYDNPDLREDLVIEHGVDLHFSSRPRRDNGTILFVSQGPFATFIVPPMTSNFEIVGQCSRDCMTRMLPPEGIRVRLKHFRRFYELPPILTDEDYRPDYQQVRFLQQPVTILPGDKLTIECTYDTTWRNGSAVLSGFSAQDETCMVFVVINKYIPFFYCGSEYSTKRIMDNYGILNMTWDLELGERIINNARHPRLVGVRLSELVRDQVWTPESVSKLEQLQKFSLHGTSCPNTRVMGELAYIVKQLEKPSGGLIRFPAAHSIPSVRSVSDPFPSLLPTTYPRLVWPYVTPEICPV